MAKNVQSQFLALEKKIAKDECDGVMIRWRYGQALRDVKGARKQLPHHMTTELIVDALRAGLKLSEREIQYRVRCATVYDSEAKVRKALADFGNWWNLIQAGFPSVEVDEDDEEVAEIDDLTATSDPGPDFIADPLFDIPGFKPVLRINGRKRDLVDVTVRDAIAYRDMCHEMHDNFGRTVAQIDASVALMVQGAAGDLDANAVEAWRHATTPPTE